MYAMWMSLRGASQFIYDYQTLLTGVAALAAAYIAAKPVWRQLRLTQTQANGVMREMLLQRQSEVNKAAEALTEHVKKPLNELGQALFWPDGEAALLDEHHAFHHDQSISRAVGWLRLDSQHRHSSMVEAALQRLIPQIDHLLNVLDDIHRPAHTDQHDEDHSFSDDAWAAFLARGEAAKGEVEGALAETTRALDATFSSLASEAATIKARLKELDEALLTAR